MVLIHLAPGSCTSEVILLKKFTKMLIAASEPKQLHKLLTRNLALWGLKPEAPILGCDILSPVIFCHITWSLFQSSPPSTSSSRSQRIP